MTPPSAHTIYLGTALSGTCYNNTSWCLVVDSQLFAHTERKGSKCKYYVFLHFLSDILPLDYWICTHRLINCDCVLCSRSYRCNEGIGCSCRRNVSSPAIVVIGRACGLLSHHWSLQWTFHVEKNYNARRWTHQVRPERFASFFMRRQTVNAYVLVVYNSLITSLVSYSSLIKIWGENWNVTLCTMEDE